MLRSASKSPRFVNTLLCTHSRQLQSQQRARYVSTRSYQHARVGLAGLSNRRVIPSSALLANSLLSRTARAFSTTGLKKSRSSLSGLAKLFAAGKSRIMSLGRRKSPQSRQIDAVRRNRALLSLEEPPEEESEHVDAIASTEGVPESTEDAKGRMSAERAEMLKVWNLERTKKWQAKKAAARTARIQFQNVSLASQPKPKPEVLPLPDPAEVVVKPDGKGLTAPRTWTPQSRRVGLIAIKKGMTAIWDEKGIRVPITVLQVEDNQVTANILTIRAGNRPPYRAVQIGAKNIATEKAHIGMRGHFRKAKVPCKQYVKEFEVSEDAHLPLGTQLSAIHFVPGQYVDVQATTMGKGFQGVMKRWGFSGGNASHGNSLAHRIAGSTGQHQDPGRVWPGTKMSGHMGVKNRTMQNLYVVRVDTHLNLIFVKGNVPGPDDGRTPIYITDAKKRLQSEALRLQLKSGGEGEWVTLDAAGKPLPPPKAGKDEGTAEVNKGLGRGVLGLPFPAGTAAMAKQYAPILVAPSVRVSSPWGSDT